MMLTSKHVGQVEVSQHAWERFKERWARLHPTYANANTKALERKLKSVFAKARPDQNVSIARRLKYMRNYRLDTVYLVNYGAQLRFVVNDATKKIVTVEIAGGKKELNKC